MQLSQMEGKIGMFPRFMRDVNSKTYKHILKNKDYRKYFEKAVRDLYRVKNYHHSGLLLFLKLYCALAPLNECNYIFNEITDQALQFAGKTRAICNQKYEELKASVYSEEKKHCLKSLYNEKCKIESVESFILYLRQVSIIDYDTVVEQYLLKMYTINKRTGYDHFTPAQKRKVEGIIKKFHEINEIKGRRVQQLVDMQFQKNANQTMKKKSKQSPLGESSRTR